MRRSTPLVLVLALGCSEIPLERQNAPPPSGVLSGTLLYIGPRPRCTDRTPVGRAVLTLFRASNRPPPRGSATSAENLLVVPGHEFFTTPEDCMPTPVDLELITRSAPFAWPGLTLGDSYVIQGFFDADADFVPFFSVRNLPTSGDIAGGAFEDPTAGGELLTITFGSVADQPLGQIIGGVVVTLAAPVVTERPMFRVGDGVRAISSEQTLPFDPDPIEQERLLWEIMRLRLELVEEGRDGYATALAAAGIEHEYDPPQTSWYVRDVDADGDGRSDLHPLLGSSGVPWKTPILYLRRAQTPEERAAGIPDVVLIGSVRPTQIMQKRVFFPTIDMMVPPIAVVNLNPTVRGCQIPYLPPGNIVQVYESGPTECQELPTGHYGLSVLQGIAAGLPVEEMDLAVSDSGWDVLGGAPSGQAWSIPNELGPADTAFDPGAVGQLDEAVLLTEQGPSARLSVFEPNGGNGVRHDFGAGGGGCDQAPDPLAGGAPRDIVYVAIPEICCTAVERFCGVPLCDPFEVGRPGEPVRRPSRLDSDGLPDCLPFEMPQDCCP